MVTTPTAAPRARPSTKMQEVVASAKAEEPLVFASLPIDLLCSVTEELDLQSVASLAAACSAFHAVAQSGLREALLAVMKRCLRGGVRCLRGVHLHHRSQ